MADSRASYRYALAVLGVAEEIKQLDRVRDDFSLIGKTIDDSREFALFLKSPVISQGKKKQLLEIVFKQSVCDLTMKFIVLITNKGREMLLPEIIRQFMLLYNQRHGIIDVAVKTAAKMTTDQQKILSDRLQKITGKSVRFTELLDPKLIGGFTVQYEDTVWDGSVKHQLETLREQLVGGAA